MYLTPTNYHWACDIETDGLLEQATRVWCATVYNTVTKEEKGFTDAESFRNWLEGNPSCILVGHNFMSFDLVCLNRFWGCNLPASRVVDTFILSQLYNPGYAKPVGCKKGAHSLEAWGMRLRYPKGEFDDFDVYSPRMLDYCHRDTRLTALLFVRLTERMRQVEFTEEGCEIEHLAWNIIQNKQKKHGFPFNLRKAQELYVTLRQRQEELKNEIYKLWPPEFLPVRAFAKARKKDGTHTKGYVDNRGKYPQLTENPDGTYTAFDWVEFNLGSPDQRIAKLQELGWVPTKFTKKTKKGGGGNPQIDEDSLLAYAELSGNKEVLALAKWIVVFSRANMVNTWMEAYNEKTGAIHGTLFIAATLRYRHSNPNSANIPAVRMKKDEKGNDQIQYGEDGAWTYESRDLFDCGDYEEWSLVGLDGTGIQNRCLIDGLIRTVGHEQVAGFTELSLRGDIHKHNINVLGLTHKAAAKKFYYSLMMGAGGALLAADQAQFGTHLTAKQGQELKEAMIASIPGFNEYIKALQRELETCGRIKLCDGTPILVSSPHMVIPYKLQGDESRLMKRAMIYVDQEINRQRLRDHVFKVADIHDEWQYKVRNKYVEQFVALALPCFRRAGESFGYNLPIDGDFKVGKTWAETH